MPKNPFRSSAVVTFCLALLTLFAGSAAHAALPPQIEARPLFGEKLVPGRWQPVVITITNGDSGEALTGEVRVALEAPNTREPLGAWITPVALPRGAGVVRTTTTLFIGERDQPDLQVFLRQGRDGRGDIVTRRTFDKQRFVDPALTLLTVTALPDALSYLRGEKLGVENSTGVLRRISDAAAIARQKNQSYRQRATALATEVQVENVPDAGLLPGTATGYDTIGIVYLGPDIGPAQFSDTQVAALRGWVTGGGLLVVASPGLRQDERFRAWVPAVGKLTVGRGLVTLADRDLTETGFGKSPAALAFWRALTQDACTEPLLGNLAQGRGLNYYYRQLELWQTVIRAPGLKAPPASAIALFLFAYLLLLVPINYLILKRLDRREWTWATVPILVTLFSVGAYVFGYALKGTQMLQNTVTLCEMGANRGESVVTASVGVFSPRQTNYDLSTTIRDTTFWTPQQFQSYGRSNQEYGPLEIASGGDAGRDASVHIRNADISMWAMRVFAARTHVIKMGRGVAANLTQDGQQLSGTVTNNTDRPLEQVSLYFGGSRTDLGSLAPGEQRKVSLSSRRQGRRRRGSSRIRLSTSGSTDRLSQEFQQPILNSVDSALEAFNQREDNQGSGKQTSALLLAWNRDEIFPVKIDGKPIPTGANLNLVTVTIPVEDQ
jgi:hypothetical protein